MATENDTTTDTAAAVSRETPQSYLIDRGSPEQTAQFAADAVQLIADVGADQEACESSRCAALELSRLLKAAIYWLAQREAGGAREANRTAADVPGETDERRGKVEHVIKELCDVQAMLRVLRFLPRQRRSWKTASWRASSMPSTGSSIRCTTCSGRLPTA